MDKELNFVTESDIHVNTKCHIITELTTMAVNSNKLKQHCKLN